MSITTDFHLHTNFSSDSNATMESMIEAGIQKGLTTMCFTEHTDFDYPVTPEHPELTFITNVPSYLKKVVKMQDNYHDKCQILHGMEIGLQPQVASHNASLVKNNKFDFVIGSIHLIDGVDPYYPEYFAERSEDASYARYFEYCMENLQAFSDIDALGHLDYIVRYGPNQNKFYSYKKFQEKIDPILHFLIAHDIALEINTGSFKYGMTVTNPCSDIIKAYHSFGGKLITIGSDAHAPMYVANQFDLVASLLKECGYTEYTVYKNRIPSFISLTK